MVGGAIGYMASIAVLRNDSRMIESNLIPAIDGVAQTAVCSKLAIMRFILGMAGDASRVITLVSSIGMAVQTL